MSQPHKDQSSKEPSVQNEELENYFANTIIPQLYVDGKMILRKFTPPVIKHFSITKDDIGRKINELEDSIQYPTLVTNIEQVIHRARLLRKKSRPTMEGGFK